MEATGARAMAMPMARRRAVCGEQQTQRSGARKQRQAGAGTKVSDVLSTQTYVLGSCGSGPQQVVATTAPPPQLATHKAPKPLDPLVLPSTAEAAATFKSNAKWHLGTPATT